MDEAGRGFGHVLNRADARSALARHDFGEVFRLIRAEASLTQEQLGTMVGLSQARVSAVERGRHHVRDIGVVVRIANALSIPGPLLGFPETAVADEPEVETAISRRHLLGSALCLVLGHAPDTVGVRPKGGVAVHPGLPGDRLGRSDVTAVEQMTEQMSRLDFRHGENLLRRRIVSSQLEVVSDLLRGDMNSDVRSAMVLALADLHMVAAWMHYDVGEHGRARKLWEMTLYHARRSGHDDAADLTARALIQVAHQALHLGSPSDALRFLSLAQNTVSAGNVSASTAGYVLANLGWCHAALGNADLALRSYEDSETFFAIADGRRRPRWSQHISSAERKGMRGLALTLLSRERPAQAAEATVLLGDAVRGLSSSQARTSLMVLPVLAVASLRAGDEERAVRAGYQAIELMREVSTKRVYSRLRTFASMLETRSFGSGVEDMRKDVCAVLAESTSEDLWPPPRQRRSSSPFTFV